MTKLLLATLVLGMGTWYLLKKKRSNDPWIDANDCGTTAERRKWLGEISWDVVRGDWEN